MASPGEGKKKNCVQIRKMIFSNSSSDSCVVGFYFAKICFHLEGTNCYKWTLPLTALVLSASRLEIKKEDGFIVLEMCSWGFLLPFA